jgi:GxxExxY protein
MLTFQPVPEAVEKVCTECVDAAIEVHRALGPGFREVIYVRAFCLELNSRGVPFETEKKILVRYRTWDIPGQRVDLLVAGTLLIEVKAIPRIRKIHHGQVLSYLKTLNLRLGLILNFSSRYMKDGIKRIIR